MGKAKQLSDAIRTAIKELKKTGMANIQIARQLNVFPSAVCRLLGRLKTTGSIDPGRRSGRPKKLDRRTTRLICRKVKIDPFISSTEIRSSVKKADTVSKTTINRTIQAMGYKSYKPRRKPLMTKSHLKKRLEFCQRHKDWTPEQWGKVMWSDESTFQLFQSSKKFLRRNSLTDACDSRYTVPVVKHPPSIMVWGCFSGHGRGGLYFLPHGVTMNATRYQEVLHEHLLPFMEMHRATAFVQDGAPCHKAKSTTRWLSHKKINTLIWPPNSPDLNPIENLWTIVKRKLSHFRPTTVTAMEEDIKKIWTREITTELCKNLSFSMPKRISSVLANKGYPSKY